MSTGEPARARALIAIETSALETSVALLLERDGAVRIESIADRACGEPSGRVLGMIATLLGREGLATASLDAVAFDAGPGSFTGLRIGCGVAQGLGFALSLPLIPVSSLEVLAHAAARPAEGRSLVLAAIDARMGQVYCAVYAGGDEPLGLEREIVVCDPQQAFARFQDALETDPVAAAAAVAIGSGFSAYPQLAAWAARSGVPLDSVEAPGAATLARLALGRLRAGRTVPASEAAPVYVRDKVALDVDEQRALRQGAAS